MIVEKQNKNRTKTKTEQKQEQKQNKNRAQQTFLPVIDDDGVGGGEVDPHPTRFGGENEQERIRRGVAKTINARLPREPREGV